jgi:hypothetical protein
MIVLTYILIGAFIGYLFGLNDSSSPTNLTNYKILEKDNKDLEHKVQYYKKVIKDLVEDNRKLVKELDDKHTTI